MKKSLLILGILILGSSSLYAQETEYVEKAVDLEDVASRLATIKPAQRVSITQPLKDNAHNEAQKLTPQEIEVLVSSQNRINKRIATQNNEEQHKDVKININDKKAVEKMLTPDIYFYDEM